MSHEADPETNGSFTPTTYFLENEKMKTEQPRPPSRIKVSVDLTLDEIEQIRREMGICGDDKSVVCAWVTMKLNEGK